MRTPAILILGLTVVMSVCSCGNSEEAELKLTLKTALESYFTGDIETYEQYVNYGTEMDSIHNIILKKAYEQRFDQLKGGSVRAVRVEPTTVAYENDSVAYVYYNIVLSDSSRETCSQKMNRICDEWKLTVRN